MKTINISLNTNSIAKAIAELEAEKSNIDTKTRLAVQRLGEIGMGIVESEYAAAVYPGNNDIRVIRDDKGDTFTIIASGSSLPFIEFGAGIRYPEGDLSAELGALPHGQYGLGQGANENGWLVYKGSPGNGDVIKLRGGAYRTWGNAPANAFPRAINEIKLQADHVVKEVFRG